MFSISIIKLAKNANLVFKLSQLVPASEHHHPTTLCQRGLTSELSTLKPKTGCRSNSPGDKEPTAAAHNRFRCCQHYPPESKSQPKNADSKRKSPIIQENTVYFLVVRGCKRYSLVFRTIRWYSWKTPSLKEPRTFAVSNSKRVFSLKGKAPPPDPTCHLEVCLDEIQSMWCLH